MRWNKRKIPCHLFSTIIPAPDDTDSTERHYWAVRSTRSQAKWLLNTISREFQTFDN